MEKFHKDKIHEGIKFFSKIRAGLVPDPMNLSEQCSFVNLPRTIVDFLLSHKLILEAEQQYTNHYKIKLTSEGRDILNRRNGFEKFYLRHVYRKEKLEYWKYRAQSVWWLPIIISLLALGVSIYAITLS